MIPSVSCILHGIYRPLESCTGITGTGRFPSQVSIAGQRKLLEYCMIFDRIAETESLQRICRPLLTWYGENRRELEWRQQPLPYYVWISEIMLQQTRVEAVKPYFSRFIEALPTIRDLALCEEDRLLKLWEGLGYYSRVRNMKKAADVVLQEYGGDLPADAKALRRLPGIGSYTAGAIASIAYGLPEPAVDGNVLRVLTRIMAVEDCIDDPRVKAGFEQLVKAFLVERTQGPEQAGAEDADSADNVPDAGDAVGADYADGNGAIRFLPGEFNQALMELGAVVCLPNGAPLCSQCPVSGQCLANQKNLTDTIPVRRKKKSRRVEKKTVLVIRDSTQTLIRKRQDRGLLAGLWELPCFEGHLSPEEALQKAEEIGVSPVRILPLSSYRHIFTHVEWEMEGYLILVEEMEPGQMENDFLTVKIRQMEEDYPIPSAYVRYTAALTGRRSVSGTVWQERRQRS